MTPELDLLSPPAPSVVGTPARPAVAPSAAAAWRTACRAADGPDALRRLLRRPPAYLPSCAVSARWQLAAEAAVSWDARLLAAALRAPGTLDRLVSNPAVVRTPEWRHLLLGWIVLAAGLPAGDELGALAATALGAKARPTPTVARRVIDVELVGVLPACERAGLLAGAPGFVPAVVRHLGACGRERPVSDAARALLAGLLGLTEQLAGTFDPLVDLTWLEPWMVRTLAQSGALSEAALLRLVGRSGAHGAWAAALLHAPRLIAVAPLTAAFLALPVVQQRADLRAPLYAALAPCQMHDVWRRLAAFAPDAAASVMEELTEAVVATFTAVDLEPVLVHGSARSRERALAFTSRVAPAVVELLRANPPAAAP